MVISRLTGKLILIFFFIVFAFITTSNSFAYDHYSTFDESPDEIRQDAFGNPRGGGAGGLYFTGSPRNYGLNCGVCHVGATHNLKIGLVSYPDDIFKEGFEPGKEYIIYLRFFNETKGLQYTDDACYQGPTCNINMFALDVLNANDEPAGQLCPEKMGDLGCDTQKHFETQTLLAKDGKTLFSRGFKAEEFMTYFKNGIAGWEFYWKAPQNDDVAIFYVSAVDGGGGDGTQDNPVDPYNDDVATIRVEVYKKGTQSVNVEGCNVGYSDLSISGMLAMIAFLIFSRRKR